MALTVNTSDPDRLLREIKAAIDSYSVRTWIYNAKGHFTHVPPQWRDEAWLKPVVRRGCLEFLLILPPGDAKQGVAGVYQGRFATMLQNHFGYSAVVSANPDQPPIRRKKSKRART